MDRLFARIVVSLAAVLLFAILILVFGPLPEWILSLQHRDYAKVALAEKLVAEKDVRTALIQAVAGILLVIGASMTWRQVIVATDQLRLNRAIKLTDALTSALEQLAATEAIARRVGGVYALDRVAQDDPSETARVVDILTAFVLQPPRHPMQRIEADVQAALDTVLNRRGTTPVIFDGARLRGARLRTRDLSSISFRAAVLVGADLRGANFFAADLSDADLSRADLTDADLRNATLAGTNFRHAVTTGIKLDPGVTLT